jgi:hypothetical protein|tara:strand:- start:2 stop:403 length:402 start_codon:yes stop_codon:yes gene_type:complete
MEFKTKQDYERYTEKLTKLSQKIRKFNLHNQYRFTDELGNNVVLVSDANDGADYGIQDGQFYPINLILHINNLLKAERKALPHNHSDYESLTYHVGHVCSRDYRFIHRIDALPDEDVTLDEVINTSPTLAKGL